MRRESCCCWARRAVSAVAWTGVSAAYNWASVNGLTMVTHLPVTELGTGQTSAG